MPHQAHNPNNYRSECPSPSHSTQSSHQFAECKLQINWGLQKKHKVFCVFASRCLVTAPNNVGSSASLLYPYWLVIVSQPLMPTINKVVEATLRLTVSQYVLVSSTLVGLATRYYFLSECCCLKFAVLYLWGALSDERTGLQFAVQSLNGPSRSEPLTIFYYLIWDPPPPILKGQVPVFISPRNRLAQ
jgi:hypothetical protein